MAPDVNAFSTRRTRFKKSVRKAPKTAASTGLRVLKPGASNRKLGWMVKKGPFRGMPIHSLTLEERQTCWEGCQNLDRCYGNNMHLAQRHAPGPELLKALEADLAVLSKKYPKGYVVRLHILGDFYSVDYVAFWQRMVERHPGMHVFGYTHWRHASDIGAALSDFGTRNGARVSLFRSDPTEAGDPLKGAVTVDYVPGVTHASLAAPGTVTCPFEDGRVKDCAHCGLCMSANKIGITFVDHSDKVVRLIRAAKAA
jgi:hypothetical protein